MAWSAVNDSLGNTYQLYSQEKNNSCACASTMMVIQLVKGKQLDETSVRRWFGEAEGSINIDQYGTRDFANVAATQSPIISVLSKNGISAHMVRDWSNVQKYVGKATRSKPGILHVAWTPAGGHWVVLVGKNAAGNYICLDPWYGVVETPLPNYTPAPGTAGTTHYFIQL
ncbi:C39 family peptidase [Hyalangium versicolor]|uniref:C39 family peptidase n=1 Tax=Hyalangium versicolor TaxID=2861190 RepID=UPI001CCE0E03|nr:C39 family peptidase [Hyalangium versicolor]